MKNPQTLDEAPAALHQVAQAGELPCMGNSSDAKSAQLFEQVLRIPASGSGQFVQLNDEVGTIDPPKGCAQDIVGRKPDPNRSHEATEPDIENRIHKS